MSFVTLSFRELSFKLFEIEDQVQLVSKEKEELANSHSDLEKQLHQTQRKAQELEGQLAELKT